jgi:hypothetical protein
MNAEAEAYPRSSAVCVTPSPPPNSSIALKRRKRRRQPACSYRRLDRSVGPKFARTCEAPWPNPQARAGRRDRRRALRKRPAMRNCAAKEALNRHVARTPDEVYSVCQSSLHQRHRGSRRRYECARAAASEGAERRWICSRWPAQGIVSKRRDLPYVSGRAKCWVKVRNPESAAMRRYEEGAF